MKIVGKMSLSSVIKICLQLVFVLGILIILFLPFLLKWYILYINPHLSYYPALILLYISGVPALVIVREFIEMFKTLKEENPFIMSNVKHLKIVSICSLIIAIEYLGGLFIITSVFAIIMVGVFIIAWLGLYILSELLKQAVKYKEENELTI